MVYLIPAKQETTEDEKERKLKEDHPETWWLLEILFWIYKK